MDWSQREFDAVIPYRTQGQQMERIHRKEAAELRKLSEKHLQTKSSRIQPSRTTRDWEFIWRYQFFNGESEFKYARTFIADSPLLPPFCYVGHLSGRFADSQKPPRETEFDSMKSLDDFHKNLHTYGKKFTDSNGNFQLKSVQDYYKKQESVIDAKSLSDLELLRREYIKRGGQNAEFLQNVMSMQSYFAHKNSVNANNGPSKHKAMINNPNALHTLRVDAADAVLESYSHPKISQENLLESFQQEMQNHTLMHIRNQLTLPSSNPSYVGGAANDQSKIAGLHSDSERMYEYLNMQETELQQSLGNLHANSFQYNAKIDELQKVRVLKNEIEKSVIVNRIFGNGNSANNSSLLQGNSFNGANQSILQNSFANRSAAAPTTRGGYSTKEGFIIRFDYLSYIPPTFSDVQIRFGIFKRGQRLDPFLHTGIYPAEQDSPNTAKCIVAEKREIHQVIPHIDAIMYFEMHASERNPQKRKIVLKAWTMHEIFDESLNLNCGRFKLPFYSKNVQQTSLMQAGGNVSPIAECNMFVRICFPNDPYFDNETLVYLESEYAMPYFHSRNDPNAPPQPQPVLKPSVQRQMLPLDPDESQRILLQDLENMPQKRPPSAADSLLQNQYGAGGMMDSVISQYQENLGTEESGKLSALMTSKKQVGARQQQYQSQQQSSQQDKLSLNQSQSSFYNTPYIQFSNKNEAAIIAPSVASRISEEPALIDGVIVHVIKLEQFVKFASSTSMVAGASSTKIPSLQSNAMLSQQPPNKKESIRVNLKIFDGSMILSDSQSKLCEATSGDTLLLPGGPNTIDFEHPFMLKIRSILQSYGPTRLRSVYLFINLINAANVSIAWLVTPLFKNMFQPPLKKAPFNSVTLKTCKPSELVLEYLIHDPELLETEIKLIDTTLQVQSQQPQQQSQQQPTLQSNTSIAKIPLGASGKMQSSMKDVTASPRNKKSQLAATKDMVIQPVAEKRSAVDGPRNLLIIDVDSVQKYTSGMSISFDLVILREQDMVNDEFGNPCVYHFEELIPAEDNHIVTLRASIKMPLDLQRAMSEKRPGWEQYHLLFKFVEVNTDDSERTLGWYVHPLFKGTRSVNQGKFVVNVNQSPIQVGAQANSAAIKKRTETFHFSVSTKLLQKAEYNKLANVNGENAVQLSSIMQKSSNNINNTDTVSSVSVEQRLYTAEVSELRGVEENVALQVNAALLLGDEFMTDDSGEKCTFQGDLKSSGKGKKVITFLEEYAFEVDIAKVAAKHKAELPNLRLVLYFLAKDSTPKYWYFCSVFDAKGVLRLGSFEVKLFSPPFQRFGQLDKTKLKESKVVLKMTLSEGIDDQ